MKTLEKEFISNVDHCGKHRFVQLKREGDVAVYCRYKLDGIIFGYEVFRIKVVKEGSPLPGGIFVEEDYEVYPSKNAFGRTAIFFATRNEIKADSIYKIFIDRFGDNNEPISGEVKDTSVFVVPSGEFTIKMLMKQNANKSYNDSYSYIKSQIDKTIKVVNGPALEKGKGKPAKYYAKM